MKKNSSRIEVPYGYCHCGCGEKTNLVTSSNKRRGYVKGAPYRFVVGHGSRKYPLDPSYKVDKSGCWIWQGGKNSSGYGCYCYERKHYLAHRYMYETLVGPIPKGLELDHSCTNRICVNPEHLRISTSSQNKCHSKKRKGKCSSKYKGVCWDKRCGAWQSMIRCNHKRHFLGYFNSEREAALAYNKTAKTLHGEYALLNEISA